MVICAMEKNKAEKNYVSGDLGGGEVINCSAIQLISCFNISGIYTYVFSITTVSKMFSEEHFFSSGKQKSSMHFKQKMMLRQLPEDLKEGGMWGSEENTVDDVSCLQCARG